MPTAPPSRLMSFISEQWEATGDLKSGLLRFTFEDYSGYGKKMACRLGWKDQKVSVVVEWGRGVVDLPGSVRVGSQPPASRRQVWCSSYEFSPSCLLYYIHLQLLNCLFSLGYKVRTSCLSSLSLYAQFLVHCQTLKRLSVFI